MYFKFKEPSYNGVLVIGIKLTAKYVSIVRRRNSVLLDSAKINVTKVAYFIKICCFTSFYDPTLSVPSIAPPS
jgi:hypothetical protein